MNFPGHRYLGPGNPIVNGTPVDSDDNIARTHDQAYDDASSFDHVRTADRAAISDFASDTFANRNWHSAVGAVGLSVKYAVESVLGPVYPSRATLESRANKRTDVSGTTAAGDMSGSKTNVGAEDMMMGDEPPNKRAKTEGKEEDEEQRSGGAKLMNLVHSGLHSYKKGTLTFMHSRIMSSYGLDYAVIEGDYKTVSQTVQLLCVTPFARVPVDIIPWYMSPTEFANLPIGASIKLCRTVCTPLGYRTPFSTNTSGVTYVNSDLYVHGTFHHGLNNTFNGVNAIPTLDTTNTMKTTSITLRWPDYRHLLWGSVINDDATNPTTIPACFGQIVHLPQYYCQNMDRKKDSVTFPVLMDHTNMFMFDQMRGQTIEWEYRPQVSVLRSAKSYVPYRNAAKADLMFGNKLFPSTMLGMVQCESNTTNKFCVEELEQQEFTGIVPYDSYIEQSGSMSHGIHQFGGGLQPPTLHVGALPVRTTDGAAPEDIAQPLVLNWKFDTYIEIAYAYDFNYPYNNIIPHELMTYSTGEGIQASAGIGHAWGYKLRMDGDSSDSRIVGCPAQTAKPRR